MANRAVGLDIGTSGVQVAEVRQQRGEASLVNFGGVALPEGAVREGEVIDVAAVATAVKQLMSDAGIRSKRVNLGVANQRVVVRQIDLPYVEDEELRASLRFQVQEYIPIPIEDAELDYHRLDEFPAPEGEGTMQRLLLVAAHRDMVESHVAAATEAGLHPVGVDLNPFAVIRALTTETAVGGGGAEALIDIGAGVTNISVHEAGIPRFVRILVLGGEDVTQGLVSGMGISRDDAEAAKSQTGLTGVDDETARGIIAERAQQFVDEIRGSLDYYQAQSGSPSVSRVLLSGGGALLEGLPDRLGTALRLPVEIGRPLDRLPVKGSKYSREDLERVEPLLTTAIGLALGGME